MQAQSTIKCKHIQILVFTLYLKPLFLKTEIITEFTSGLGHQSQGMSASYCISMLQTTLIKAAQKTNHICSALIYMQLKFHVNEDKPGGRGADKKRGMRAEEEGGGCCGIQRRLRNSEQRN